MLGSRNNNVVLLTLVETMIAPADLLDRQEKLDMGKAENLWKEMFTKALVSMKKLEKEITHHEEEVQSLRSLVKGLKAVKLSIKQTNLHILAESKEYLCQCHRGTLKSPISVCGKLLWK